MAKVASGFDYLTRCDTEKNKQLLDQQSDYKPILC